MSTGSQPSAKFVRLAHLCRLRGRQQVAAVCYRLRGDSIEFLLVRTRGSGRWTFPKGSAEPGLTHAQAAALEAFEEAGVHGRMQEASFASYIRSTRRGASGKEQSVLAHLCEVTRLEAPQEFDRHPTWLSPEKAKRCLGEDRNADYAADLARVLDRAVARIKRVRLADTMTTPQPKDGLQKVQFIDCAWTSVDPPKISNNNGKPRRQFLN
ncbi:MAG: NUDIX domain-containing protein [Terriglobales bacterium]